MTLPRPRKSTIVRVGWHTTRAAFRLAETGTPHLSAWMVERMWFRLPARRRRVGPADGTAFEVRADGHLVRGRHWGEGPPVYLVHGWGGYGAQLGAFVGPLVERGFTVVTFDAPSHGESEPGPSGPRESHGVEFGKALDAVAARFGPAHLVVAHSMGALATLLALKHGWLATRRLAMVAPMTDLDHHLRQFAAMAGFGPRTRAAFDTRVLRRVGLPVGEFDVRRLAEQIDRPDLLVVHDRDDRETPYAASASLVAAWPDARLVPTRGLGHRRLLRDAAVVSTVVEFAESAAARAVA
jgi:pimeloyl-ACP methyl ester carboxylesterase